jgi:glucose/arabinose dehydrogenase
MLRLSSMILMVLLLASGCAFFEKEDHETPGDEAIVLQHDVETVAEKLSVPWSINKVNEAFYISERTGSIAVISEGTVERQPVQLKKPLAQAAEAGLLGFVLAPDFPESQKAYAYYTYSEGDEQFNRVVVIKSDGSAWREDEILLGKIPSAANHHGGRLKIGPDDKLYITTGDATVPESAQDRESLNGKILRMNLDGSIPSDNPFGPDSYVYSYGHRNPQGLAWIGSRMYASEHGQSAHDEINEIKPGANYGWPVIQGSEKRSGMVTPLFHSGEETWAPSGLAATQNGKLYVAALRGNAVREVDLEADRTKPVITGLGRIRDVYIDGDYLYFVSNNTDGRGTPDEGDDRLYRVLLRNLK